MNSGCVFCEIASGRLPAAKLYEDEHCLAFLDIRPIFRGHALVIPRRHSVGMAEAAPAALSSMMRAVQRLGPAVVKAVRAEAFNLFQADGEAAGQTVFHLHFHVLPRRKGDGFADHPLRELEREAMEEKFSELESLAEKIKKHL